MLTRWSALILNLSSADGQLEVPQRIECGGDSMWIAQGEFPCRNASALRGTVHRSVVRRTLCPFALPFRSDLIAVLGRGIRSPSLRFKRGPSPFLRLRSGHSRSVPIAPAKVTPGHRVRLTAHPLETEGLPPRRLNPMKEGMLCYHSGT
jgi:hypothetical protein